jgi:hypothetical protein
MNDLIKKLLLALGFTEAQINAASAETPTATLEELTKAAQLHARQLLENDNEFVTAIKAKGKAEVYDVYERAFKKHGLKAEELKDADGKAKKPEEVVKLLTDKANAGKDQTLQDLQNENVSLKAEVEKLKTEEIPTIKSQVEEEKNKLKINILRAKKLQGMGELRNPLEVIEAALDYEFNGKYKVELNEKGDDIIFKDKNGLQVKNAAGTAFLSADEILKDALTRNKFIAESNADDPANKKPPVIVQPGQEANQQGNESKAKFAGLDKAEAKLKAAEQAKTKA